MTKGSYSYGLVVPASVYGPYAYPSKNFRAAPDHLKVSQDILDQEDNLAQQFAKCFMTKHRPIGIKLAPVSDCYPRHLWSDPTKLSACFFSQASRIVFLVTSNTIHLFNAFVMRRIFPLLTKPLEKHGRPTWNSRFVIILIGRLQLCDEAWDLLPDGNIIEFSSTCWNRDLEGFELLKLVIENLWVSVEPQTIINSIHEDIEPKRGRYTAEKSEIGREYLTESDRQIRYSRSRELDDPPRPEKRLQLAKKASMREDSHLDTLIGTKTRVSGSVYRNNSRWEASDSSPEKNGTLDRSFTPDLDKSAHTVAEFKYNKNELEYIDTKTFGELQSKPNTVTSRTGSLARPMYQSERYSSPRRNRSTDAPRIPSSSPPRNAYYNDPVFNENFTHKSSERDTQDFNRNTNEFKRSSITIPVKQSILTSQDWDKSSSKRQGVTETMRSFVREEVNEKVTYSKGVSQHNGPSIETKRSGWQSESSGPDSARVREPSPTTIDMLRRDLQERSKFKRFLEDDINESQVSFPTMSNSTVKKFLHRSNETTENNQGDRIIYPRSYKPVESSQTQNELVITSTIPNMVATSIKKPTSLSPERRTTGKIINDNSFELHQKIKTTENLKYINDTKFDHGTTGKQRNSYSQITLIPKKLGILQKILRFEKKVEEVEHICGHDGEPYNVRRFIGLLARLKCTIYKEKSTETGIDASETRIKEIEEILKEKLNKSLLKSIDDDEPLIEVFKTKIIEARSSHVGESARVVLEKSESSNTVKANSIFFNGENRKKSNKIHKALFWISIFVLILAFCSLLVYRNKDYLLSAIKLNSAKY